MMGLLLLSLFWLFFGLGAARMLDGDPRKTLFAVAAARRDSARAALDAAYERGRAEAISALVEIDENAAIIEALAAGTLANDHGFQWKWHDADLKRADLSAVGKTPREAYRSYKAQRAAAAAICEQLDEVERVRKEATGEAA